MTDTPSAANTVTIRERTPNDLDRCAELLMEVHHSDGYPVEGVADPRGWLTPKGTLISWVAEVDGSIAGHVSVAEGRDEDAVTLWRQAQPGCTASVAVLARLFVPSARRGLGLGEQLTRQGMAYAAEQSMDLVLDVMEKDQAAIRLYKRLGWLYLGPALHSLGQGARGKGQEVEIPAYCYGYPCPRGQE